MPESITSEVQEKVDHCIVMQKISRLLECKNYSSLAERLRSHPEVMSRIRSNGQRISGLMFLRAANLLNMTPKELMKAVGLPLSYFDHCSR